MPNVGLKDSVQPVPEDTQVSIRYVVEVGGLPVYSELYDVDKLAKELEEEPEGTTQAWVRRLTVPVESRHKPRFSVEVTAGLHPLPDST